MSRFRRILHATDFSRASGAAFKSAVDMAKANHAQLLLVHVMNPAPLVGYGEYVPPQAYEEIRAYARAAGQKRLNALEVKAKRAGVPTVVPGSVSSSSAAWRAVWLPPPRTPC